MGSRSSVNWLESEDTLRSRKSGPLTDPQMYVSLFASKPPSRAVQRKVTSGWRPRFLPLMAVVSGHMERP